MAKTIQVTGVGNDRKVILWEKSPAHPRGEIMIVSDGKLYTVAETAAVKRLLGEGRLVLTQQSPVRRQQTPPTETRDVTPQGIKWIGQAGYAEMNVGEAIDYIRSLSDTEQAIVLEFEKRNKNRPTLLREFD